ncbi:hypothetical protein ACR6C2_08595 [Streptomyces sp. INA 01156]
MSADWWIRSTGGQVGSDNGLKAVREELPGGRSCGRWGRAVRRGRYGVHAEPGGAPACRAVGVGVRGGLHR